MDKLIVVGGGELGRVVIEAAQSQGFDVIGFVDPQPCEETVHRLRVPRLGKDDDLVRYPEPMLVLGVGSTAVSQARSKIVAAIEASSVRRWAIIIHPHASVSKTAILGEGVIVLPGAVIGTGARISRHTIVNLGAKIDHDVSVGEFVHIAPQAVLGGGSSVGDHAYVGIGAAIRDHTSVADFTMVGMGAVVTQSFPTKSILVGVPAKPMKST